MDNPLRERRIRAAMDREAAHAVPHADLWPAIQRQLRREQAATRKAAGLRPRPPLRRFAPRPHLRLAFFNGLLASLLVVSLAVLLVLPPAKVPQSGSLATTMPPATSYPVDDSTMMPMTMAVRAQPLHLSQTVNGYTVLLDHVYLDASVLMLSYSIVGPHTRYLNAMGDLSHAPAPAVMTYDTAFTSNSWTGNNSIASANKYNAFSPLPSESWQTANQGADGSTVHGIASFDPPAAISTSLNLHLSLNLTYNPPIDINSVSPPLTTNQTQAIAGPFTFDFTAPFVGDLRIINVGQQATASGLTITLDQALLTPSQTRLRLRYDGVLRNARLAWQPDLTFLGPNGQPASAMNPAEVSQQPDGSWLYIITTPPYMLRGQRATPALLYSQSGQWTLRIDALHSYDIGDPNPGGTAISGPWTFQFTVPPQ